MFLATINKSKQLLYLIFIQQVSAAELAQGREDIATLIADLTPGFRLLADLERLDSFGADCTPELAKTMDLLDRSGVGLVLRVIPDTTKDLGLNILSLFHYHSRPRILSCSTMLEAAKLLSI